MLGGLFKAFQVMSTISNWSEQALADGKVTLKEATELAEDVCKILGVPLEIEINKEVSQEPETNTEEAGKTHNLSDD